MQPLESLIACGTKLWLDSVDPDLVRLYHGLGATGATSNPVIIAGVAQSGKCDAKLNELLSAGHDDEAVAWQLTDHLVREAQSVFHSIWKQTSGNDGYVSFELDPLLEDVACPLSLDERIERYVETGKMWAAGHDNRMIKVPATPAGLGALEDLAAAGVRLNVTLLFSQRQYEAARDAVWRGAQRSANPQRLKSVFSIFVSRIDGYIAGNVPSLSEAAGRQVAVANAQHLWKLNQDFWRDKPVDLDQEIVFASMGPKLKGDSADRYVTVLAGSDIQTNPPEVNEAIAQMNGKKFSKTVDQFLPDSVLDEIREKVDMAAMESALMADGLKKFADPQKGLLASIARLRAAR